MRQVARGEAVGAAWMMTGGAHDNSAVCIRDSELVRMSRVRSSSVHGSMATSIRSHYTAQDVQ